jgi:hypothetical protein
VANPCPLCDGVGDGVPWRAPRFCLAPSSLPPETCWQRSPIAEVVWCSQSLGRSILNEARRAEFLTLLRRVGEAYQHGPENVDAVLQSLAPESRGLVMRYCTPPLRIALAKRIAQLPNPALRPPLKEVRIAETLPAPLREGLEAYRARLKRRYDALVERGHERAPRYLRDEMRIPLRLAEFLASIGIARWDVVRKRDLVAFFQQHPLARRQPIERFLRSLDEQKPFRERRGRPASGSARMRDAQRRPPPKVVAPEVLSGFLSDVRARYSTAEYLLAWMACRLSMMVRPAHAITLDRFRLNEAGRLVIRPAKLWVEVPPRVAPLFREIITAVEPTWGEVEPETLRHVTLFDHYISDVDTFSAQVLQNRTRLLRSSGVYAAMLSGHLDRVTLHNTMGVSIPTIVQLERLLAVDMHRRLDPELVEQRNAHIIGRLDD